MEQLDGIAIGSVIASGEATAAEVVAEAIQRCEALNPNLNAVIHENFDRAVDRASQVVPGSSPLAGVPMVTKDLVCCEAGLPFHEGSRFLKEIGYTSETDQDVAVRFRQGDMVSIGRTNTPEFGMQPATEPLAYGPTHNPWQRGYSPGGSSGGSAAAVAAGIVPIGHGNDVGGSLRNPASMCGLVGLKPSRGRSRLTPDFGDAMLGMAESLVMTRSVRDTAAALDLLVESRVDDVYHHPVPAGGWLAGLVTPAGRVRVGYLIPDATSEPVRHAVRDTLKRLEELGHHVEDASPAALDEDITPLALPNLTAGTAHIVDRHWPRVAGVDAIPPDLLEPTTAFLADLGRSVSGADLLEARELAQQWTRRLLSWWINDGYDVLVTPTIPVLPPKHGETDDQTLISLALPFNLSGLPAVSVPAAVHDGLPIGVQLVASMFREDHLLGLAQELETATGWLSWKP